jgi:hypothetical protein
MSSRLDRTPSAAELKSSPAGGQVVWAARRRLQCHRPSLVEHVAFASPWRALSRGPDMGCLHQRRFISSALVRYAAKLTGVPPRMSGSHSPFGARRRSIGPSSSPPPELGTCGPPYFLATVGSGWIELTLGVAGSQLAGGHSLHALREGWTSPASSSSRRMSMVVMTGLIAPWTG